ncbi:AMP-binding protein [Tsukamurella sp. 8F]|uniref:AMP-binding protein n=1 Tax=unclassified Tsukamurella TaxID=2633480 RepID=UPI0023B889D7|nr:MULTISPECIES: AMP-binding protein [unclassified Tsukamurella]MDF0528623.1 AMP-binding protein [Tsukamurella sp. 8J]MDF0585585.1 AMP-binding protein [Tsukamurella sp. 8F]
MKIEHRVVVAAPIEDVWNICADPMALARYVDSGVRVTPAVPGRKPELDARYRILVRVGGALVGGDVIVVECQPPWEFSWSSITGVSHRVRLRLRPVPGGTAVTLRFTYDAPGAFGAIADFASYPAMWSTMKNALHGMKAAAEGGAEMPGGRALPQRLIDEVGHLGVLARAGIVAPMRPDRLVRIAFAARNWGLSPGALAAVGEARHPDRAAVVDGDGELTYAELDRQSSAIGSALRESGVGEGDAVALLARNHRGFLLAMSAAAKLGCDVLLLNTGFSGPQIADVCRREGPSAVIYDAEFGELVANAVINRRQVIADGISDSAGVPTLTSLAAAGEGRSPASPGRAGRITILTSGTTGTPKGASRGASSGAQGPTLEAPAALLERIPLREGMRVGLAAPMFHAWGLSNLLLSQALGATVVCLRKFDPEGWLAAIDEYRLEALVVVPVMLSRILELPEETRGRYETSSLRIVAASGSALPGDLSDRWMDTFGENLYNLYGSTEVANATIATPADLRAAPGTAGRPTRGTTVKLLDDAGIEVPQGSVGRIFVGNSQLFEGYSGGGDKQRMHGMMATGDVGRFDPAGRLFVEGRDDDMIVSGGENVFPKEVEDTIARHPAVAEVAAIGVEDEQFGQRLRAFVVLRDGTDVSADELKARVKSELAGYKVPREIVFLDALPRNATGKVLRRELAES